MHMEGCTPGKLLVLNEKKNLAITAGNSNEKLGQQVTLSKR